MAEVQTWQVAREKHQRGRTREVLRLEVRTGLTEDRMCFLIDACVCWDAAVEQVATVDKNLEQRLSALHSGECDGVPNPWASLLQQLKGRHCCVVLLDDAQDAAGMKREPGTDAFVSDGDHSRDSTSAASVVYDVNSH